MTIFDKGFYTILGCAVLMILIAVPLALRKIPPNVVYGYRTRATLANDEIWYAANAHFGRGLIVASVCGAALAYLLHRFQPLPPDVFLPVSVGLLAAPALVAAVATSRFVRALKD
jgi:hypothetical protein